MAAFVCIRLVRNRGSLEQQPAKQSRKEFAGSKAAKPTGVGVPGRPAYGPLRLSQLPHAISVQGQSFPAGPATVETLGRNSFSPPHKISFQGTQ